LGEKPVLKVVYEPIRGRLYFAGKSKDVSLEERVKKQRE